MTSLKIGYLGVLFVFSANYWKRWLSGEDLGNSPANKLSVHPSVWTSVQASVMFQLSGPCCTCSTQKLGLWNALSWLSAEFRWGQEAWSQWDQWFSTLAAPWITGNFKKLPVPAPYPQIFRCLGYDLGSWSFKSSPGDLMWSQVQPRLRITVLKGFPHLAGNEVNQGQSLLPPPLLKVAS